MGVELRLSLTRCIKKLYGSLRGSLKGKQLAQTPSSDLKDAHSITSTLIAGDEETALRNSSSKPIQTVLPTQQYPSSRPIFTRNIISILISFAILPLHNSTFMHLWSIFLSTPRAAHSHKHTFFAFTGGLGLHPHQVGLAMSYLGVLGIILQLLCYPPLQAKLGLLRSFRLSCLIFPLAYVLTPFLALLSGPLMWFGVALVLLLQVSARTFALPGSVILLTNSVEHRAVMGTIQGCATSLASASRAVGPVLAGALYALGLEGGVVGGVFWGMAGVAGVGAWSTWFIREGKGIVQEETGEEDALLGVRRVV